MEGLRYARFGRDLARRKPTYVFLPQRADCYHHVFSQTETTACAGGKWFFFAGGHNAFALYASLMQSISPGFVSSQKFSVQFGHAYDFLVDTDGGKVVYYNRTALGFEEGRLSRVHAVAQTRGNPSHTTVFAETQKQRYADFLSTRAG